MNRRDFVHRTFVGGATLGLGVVSTGCSRILPTRTTPADGSNNSFELEELTIADLQRGMDSGRFTAVSLCQAYLEHAAAIDQSGPRLKSIIELNPDAVAIAAALDAERKAKGSRGPLHGIPVLIKDNIDTRDRMTTTAGSLALVGSIATRDSFVVEKLRSAGAVILGKTNLSEWANFRGSRSISGWSGRGGQTRNPYAIDRSPSGSSSGSAAAVSANLCAVAIGTETNGSIISPASYCGVVGFKPTVGLVSRSGIIPIAASQDTAGPMARTVTDAAILLGALAGKDPRDSATSAAKGTDSSDYTRLLDANALHGARIGVLRSLFKLHPQVDPVMESALEAIKRAGAILVDDVKLPSRQDLGGADYQVMLYEFKAGLNAYFASLGASSLVKSLGDLITFNERNRERELVYFGQEILVEAQAKGPLTEQRYVDAKAKCAQWSRDLAAKMDEHRVDALVAPSNGPAHTLDLINGDRGLGGSSTYAAVAGLPNITVPCGHVFGLPVSVSFFGRAWNDHKILALAYSFEQTTKARQAPRFLPTVNMA